MLMMYNRCTSSKRRQAVMRFLVPALVLTVSNREVRLLQLFDNVKAATTRRKKAAPFSETAFGCLFNKFQDVGPQSGVEYLQGHAPADPAVTDHRPQNKHPHRQQDHDQNLYQCRQDIAVQSHRLFPLSFFDQKFWKKPK